jgi:PAS domain S-box-containing protein
MSRVANGGRGSAGAGPEPTHSAADVDRHPPPATPAAGAARRSREVLAIAVGLALLAATCGMAAVLALENQWAARVAIDARQAQRAGTLAFQAALGAESSQRGFLLTRDPDYLAPYGAARTAFAAAIVDARRYLADDPSSRTLTAEIGRLGEAKFSEMDLTISQAQKGDFDEAIATARSGHGKELMDQIRSRAEALATHTQDAVATSTAAQIRVSRFLLLAIVVALGCVVCLAGLLLRDLRRRIGELRARQDALNTLTVTLEREVARRTSALAEANQRFAAALRASGVTVMTQDRDLTFTWISNGEFGRNVDEIVGRTQEDAYTDLEQSAALNLKRKVIETGEPVRADVCVARNGVETWYDLSAAPLTDAAGEVTGLIAGAIDITRYKEQEARIRLLSREATHRAKNLLAVTQAIMRQTAANSDSIEDFQARFSERLLSLSSSHDLLVQRDWKSASLREVVLSQLAHYSDQTRSRVVLKGESIDVEPDAAQHIGMAIHELATNAAKFGALSTPDGEVAVSWGIRPGLDDGTTCCFIAWTEAGGPPVKRPARRGFGRVVAERTVARAVRGEVTVDYAPDGLRWLLVFPSTFLKSA